MTSPLHNPGGVPERVVPLNDPASGLVGLIVVHSTRLGPAGGGCRLWTYPTREAACHDALRLAEGMAFKNALAGLPMGGGKAVLMHPDKSFDRREMMRAFGRAVQALDGVYVTAEDVGTSPSDMEDVASETRHVAGCVRVEGPGGDPSPWTARGVFEAMRVAVERRYGRPLSEVTVAVQGLGNVGYALCRLLHDAGAKLIVAEPRSAVVARAAVEFGAEIQSSGTIALAQAEVFAPCALGGVLTVTVAHRMRAGIVCGAANNQLAEPSIAQVLTNRGVLYAPDYLVNAGGIINVAAEYFGWPQGDVEARIAAVGPRLAEVLSDADERGVTTAQAADERAMAVIRAGKTRLKVDCTSREA